MFIYSSKCTVALLSCGKETKHELRSNVKWFISVHILSWCYVMDFNEVLYECWNEQLLYLVVLLETCCSFNKMFLSVFSRLWTGSKLELLLWKQWLQHWLSLRLVDYNPGLIIEIQYSTFTKSIFINTLHTFRRTIIYMFRLELKKTTSKKLSLQIRHNLTYVCVYPKRLYSVPTSDACTHILLDDVRDDFPQGQVGRKNDFDELCSCKNV